MTRGWDLILPGCRRNSTLSRGASIAACCLYIAPDNQQSANEVEISTPYGAVSTRVSTFIVPEL